MKPEDIRKLYDRETPATDAEAKATAHQAATEPESARQLWQVLLAMVPTDKEFEMVLRWIIDSVMIDHITNQVQHDDDFALVISRRILRSMDVMKPTFRAGRYRKHKSA
jgi:3-hydroxyisobutyrate dehydrogenase-like beta-hydroxyacid dehydrogenase